MKMKLRIVFSLLFMISGILLIIIPRFILPVCAYEGFFVKTASGGSIPMKCHYTMISEGVLGAVLIAVSILFLFASTRQAARLLSGAVSAISIAAVLIPVKFPGVCGNPKMPCLNGTRPGLILAGTIILFISFAAILTARGNEND